MSCACCPTPLHLQEDLRRVREERTVSTRDLQLDASSAKAEASRLAQELQKAESAAEGLRHAAEQAQRAALQVGGRQAVQHSGGAVHSAVQR